MNTIVTVLKSGGDFEPHHVESLYRQCKKHIGVEHDFVCYTDTNIGEVPREALEHNLYGWWSKIEIFMTPPERRCVYLDLDTVLVDNADSLFNFPEGSFEMLNPFSPKTRNPSSPREKRASGVMAWHGDFSCITERFFKMFGEKNGMALCRWVYKNDQDFIYDSYRSIFGRDPGLVNSHANICSYKHHCRDSGSPPKGIQVVCFHGKPRPWEAEDEWVKMEL